LPCFEAHCEHAGPASRHADSQGYEPPDRTAWHSVRATLLHALRVAAEAGDAKTVALLAEELRAARLEGM